MDYSHLIKRGGMNVRFRIQAIMDFSFDSCIYYMCDLGQISIPLLLLISSLLSKIMPTFKTVACIKGGNMETRVK